MADLKVRSNNFKSMLVTAPSPTTYVKGFLTKVSQVVCVIVDDIAALATGAAIYQCDKIVLPKRVGTTCVFAVGAKVYYNGTNNNCDIAVTSTYTLIGRCLVAAGATATEVEIDFNGACAA